MPIIDRPKFFGLLIMSDKDGEEDPKVISVGSFEDLRSYFDQTFSHLKRELSDDQLKSSSPLVKKLKTETSLAATRSSSILILRLWNTSPRESSSVSADS